jgi:hypothetical protein
MISFLRIPLLLSTAIAAVAEPSPPPTDPPQTPQPTTPARPSPVVPWLGFDVRKADETTAAQLPSLPQGIGFVIRSIEPDSPAAAAAIQPLDVVWKFGDQLLVNEGQLATLLRLHKPGDVVALSLFRAGKHAETKITLGEAPPGRIRPRNDMLEAAIIPGGGSRMINLANRTAHYNSDDGRLILRRSEDDKGYELSIQGPDEAPIFQGTLDEHGDNDDLPPEWRKRVCTIRRSLDHVLEGRMVPVRQPRPRVTPPPAQDDK